MEKGLSNEERWSEMDLLRRLRDKQLGAYRELIDRYYGFVYMIAYQLHRDERMADQYVLELFAHIWNDSERVCDEETIRQYFFRLIYDKYQRYVGVLAEAM